MSDHDDPDPSRLRIEITVDQNLDFHVSRGRVSQAARAAAAARGFTAGEIGIRITDDQSIRELNQRHLNHDYETDVISFSYGCSGNEIAGELVVSADTARRRARQLGWNEDDELLLYVVHGVLHLTGMNDHQPGDRQQMRQLEQQVMLSLGVDQIVHFGADMNCDRQSDSPEASA